MSSNVCQRLQSCLEPLIIEPPRGSKMKLAPPKPNFSRSFSSPLHCLPQSDLKKAELQPVNEEKVHSGSKAVEDSDLGGRKNGESGGWEFIQALINPSYAIKESFDKEKVYVHPLMKRSTSMILDQRSLEMCTESLGAETGSCTSKIDDEAHLMSHKSGKKCSVQSKKPEIGATKKMHHSRSFPPPLSSISSSDCVQVRPHRAGGRLVIRAVTVSSCHTYFHAERGDGRLRLRFLKGCFQNLDHEEEDKDEDEDEDEEFLEEVEDFEGREEEEEDYREDIDEDDSDSLYWCKDIEGNNGNIGVEIGIENLRRPTRCMDGVGHGDSGLLNCETLWVAT